MIPSQSLTFDAETITLKYEIPFEHHHFENFEVPCKTWGVVLEIGREKLKIRYNTLPSCLNKNRLLSKTGTRSDWQASIIFFTCSSHTCNKKRNSPKNQPGSQVTWWFGVWRSQNSAKHRVIQPSFLESPMILREFK